MTNKKELKKRDRQLDKSRHRMKIEKATGFRTDRKKIKNKDSELVKGDTERKFKKQRHEGKTKKIKSKGRVIERDIGRKL